MSSHGAGPRAIGGTLTAIVGTVVGVAAATLLPLTGLAWGIGGFTVTDSWEDGESHFLLLAAGFCVLVWIVLLGIGLIMCLGEKTWRESWQTGLAVTVGVLSVVSVLIAFSAGLSAISGTEAILIR
jgi:hypothetical protein